MEQGISQTRPVKQFRKLIGQASRPLTHFHGNEIFASLCFNISQLLLGMWVYGNIANPHTGFV